MLAKLFSLALCGILVNATPLTLAPTPITVGPGALPPRYLEVKDWQKCFGTCAQSGNWCLPAAKPADCCPESWAALGKLSGRDIPPKCADAPKPPVVDPIKPPVVGPGGIPPKYLGVKDWQKCFGKCAQSGNWCFPAAKPADCCPESWAALSKLSGRDIPDKCANAPKPPVVDPIKPPIVGPGGIPPKYLDVKDWQKCFGKCAQTGNWCFPAAKPADCCPESWAALSKLSGRDIPSKCADAPKPPVVDPIKPPVVGPGGIPPKYLGVKDWQKCFGKCAQSGNWCFPAAKPADCCPESWAALSKLSGRDIPDKCANVPTPPIVGPGGIPPKYLGVKDWQKCFGKCAQTGNWCFPAAKPAECCPESWAALSKLSGRDIPSKCAA